MADKNNDKRSSSEETNGKNKRQKTTTTTTTRSSFGSSMCEPDVTVVVGGVEFQHHGLMLCSLSGFFHAALHSEMRESQNNRVCLQGDNWNPDEWKEVAKFFDAKLAHSPAGAMVTEDNVLMLLPWFHYLQMPNLLQTCEACLREMTLQSDDICGRVTAEGEVPVGGFSIAMPDLARRQAELSLLCDSFAECLRYGLVDLKTDIQGHLVHVLEASPDFFTLDSVRTLVSALAHDSSDDKETRHALWEALQMYVPTEFHCQASQDDDFLQELLQSPLLPHTIHNSMWQHTLAKRERRLPRVLTDKWIVPSMSNNAEVQLSAEQQRSCQQSIRDYLRCFPIHIMLDQMTAENDAHED